MLRTWEDGVKDAIRIVENEMRHKKAIDYPSAKVPIAVFATLNEVELHLAAMLSRGSYESHDTVMQGLSAGDVARRDIEAQEEAAMISAVGLPVGDPQPVPCPDCGGTGSDCTKFPITGCATCEGDGRLQTNPRWEQNEVQFARLLCELNAIITMDWEDHRDLVESMGLSADDIEALFKRAEEVWEKAKAEVK